MLRTEPVPKIPRALKAVEESPVLAEVLRLCLLGRYDDGAAMIAKGDAIAYRDGDAGVLAGALAAHYGEHETPGWKAWLPAARAVLEIKDENRGQKWSMD